MEIVPEALNHTGAATFDSHLIGLQAVLRNWKASGDVANAGLWHSIYGTQGFQGFEKLPWSRRSEVRELIGAQAERFVWIFCMADRKSVDDTLFLLDNDQEQRSRSFVIRARAELGRFDISFRDEQEWLDFLELTVADWLEQVCILSNGKKKCVLKTINEFVY